jgi:hypothetical protein
MSWLDNWLEEDRPDLDEQVAEQDRLLKRGQFTATFSFEQKTQDPHYGQSRPDKSTSRSSDRRVKGTLDGEGGADEVVWNALGDEEFPELHRKYNPLLDKRAEIIFFEMFDLAIKAARARKPHTKDAWLKKLREYHWRLWEPGFDRNGKRVLHTTHIGVAVHWVALVAQASEIRRRKGDLALRLLQSVIENQRRTKPKRQADRHADSDTRRYVFLLNVLGKAAGLSDRANFRQIDAVAGIKRSTAQRWVAQFSDESTNPVPMEGLNMTKETATVMLADAIKAGTAESFERLERLIVGTHIAREADREEAKTYTAIDTEKEQ